MITQLASPEELRSFAVRSAGTYTQMAQALALRDATVATSAQLLADTYRVVAALWTKAQGDLDPEQAWFRLASAAFAQVSAAEAPPADTRAGVLVGAARRRWSAALAGMHVPLVFPAPAPVADPVDLVGARARYLRGMSPQQYVRARARQSADLPGPGGLVAGLDAYLVDAAVAAGDGALLTVYARAALLGSRVRAAGDDLAAAARAAGQVLGPVELVRASAYHPAL